MWLLYRSPQVQAFLVRHPARLVIDRQGIFWREVAPRRPPLVSWLMTARVAALTYSPLMLVPCLVAVGGIFDGRLIAVPVVVAWFAAGFAASHAVLIATFFLLRGKRWARGLLVAITGLVLLVDLPLCWLLLGMDGLIRDGGPLVGAAGIALYGVWRAGRTDRADAVAPIGPPVAEPAR